MNSARPRLHVCSLDRIGAAVEETGARSLVTLLSKGTLVTRPPAIAAERHLYIAMSDIIDPTDGHILPAAHHVHSLLKFVGGFRISFRLHELIAAAKVRSR